MDPTTGGKAPYLETAELADHILTLPRDAQLGILRTVAPRVLGHLDPAEREGFLRDLEAEIVTQSQGGDTYDIREGRLHPPPTVH